MPRFVSMKIKGRSSKADQPQENNLLPVAVPPTLELSLPDSKSFRSSLILPDLSQRFSILRSHSDLASFQQHLRQQRDMGQITPQDESIILKEYQRHSALKLLESTADVDSRRSHPIKPGSSGSNSLFSGKAAARDVAYLRKTMRVSNKLKHSHSAGQILDMPDNLVQDTKPKTVSVDQDLEGDLETLLTTNISSGPSTSPEENPNNVSPSPASLVGQSEQLNSSFEEAASQNISPKQLHRISKAIDRILDHHLIKHENLLTNFPEEAVDSQDRPPITSSTSSLTRSLSPSSFYSSSAPLSGAEYRFSTQPSPDIPQPNSQPPSQCEGAETRVREELFKALSATTPSDPTFSSTSSGQPPGDMTSSVESPASTLSFSSPTPPDLYPGDEIPLGLGDERRLSFCSANSEILSICSSSFDPRGQRLFSNLDQDDFDYDCLSLPSEIPVLLENEQIKDLSPPALSSPYQTLDRNQTVPFTEVPYKDLMFIQKILVSSTRSRTSIPDTRKGAPSWGPSSRPSFSTKSPPATLNRKTSSSTTTSNFTDRASSPGVQDRIHPSDRSSSLRPRNKKNVAKQSHFVPGTVSYQSLNLEELSDPTPCHLKSPSVGSLSDGANLLSPSLTMTPDNASFPLTPPCAEFESNLVVAPKWSNPSIINQNKTLSKDQMSSSNGDFVPPLPPANSIDSLSSPFAIQMKRRKEPPREVINRNEQSLNSSSQARPSAPRGGRPVPTTMLFRDVEAQAVAANIALRKAAAGLRGESEAKGASRKKKSIKITQIGAPKLLSASADLNTFELGSISPRRRDVVYPEPLSFPHLNGPVSVSFLNNAQSGSSMASSLKPQTCNGSGAVRAQMRREKISESGAEKIPSRNSQNNKEVELSIEPQPELNGSSSRKQSITWNNPFEAPQTNAEALDRESMNVSPLTRGRSSTSSKHQSGPLKSLRKLMGGARRSFKQGPGYVPWSAGRENESFETKVEAHDYILTGPQFSGHPNGFIEPLKIHKTHKDHAEGMKETITDITQEVSGSRVGGRACVSVPDARGSGDTVSRLLNDLGFNSAHRKGFNGRSVVSEKLDGSINLEGVTRDDERESEEFNENVQESVIFEAEEEDIFPTSKNQETRDHSDRLEFSVDHFPHCDDSFPTFDSIASANEQSTPLEFANPLSQNQGDDVIVDEAQPENAWESQELSNTGNEENKVPLDLTKPSYLEMVQNEEHDDSEERPSDYAASILDFYGGESSSTGDRASSISSGSQPARASNLSFTSPLPEIVADKPGETLMEEHKDEVEAIDKAGNHVEENNLPPSKIEENNTTVDTVEENNQAVSKFDQNDPVRGDESNPEAQSKPEPTVDEVFGLVRELKNCDSRYSKFIVRQKSQRRKQFKELDKLLPSTGTSISSKYRNGINVSQTLNQHDSSDCPNLFETNPALNNGVYDDTKRVLIDDDEEEAEIWKQILDS